MLSAEELGIVRIANSRRSETDAMRQCHSIYIRPARRLGAMALPESGLQRDHGVDHFFEHESSQQSPFHVQVIHAYSEKLCVASDL